MDDIENKAIQNLLYRVGSEVVSNARDNAPYVTGNLHNDIQVFDDNIENLEIAIGNSKLAPYASYVYIKEPRRIYHRKRHLKHSSNLYM